MVIRSGEVKRRSGHADHAKADHAKAERETGTTQLNAKDVPQFAPNFSVYVLPPDVVCLYSEDRKFFLYGELYCAVAAAIGAGKSFAESLPTCSAIFPPTKSRKR